MKSNKLLALLIGFLTTIPALAGPINDAFSTSVIGIPWGANQEQIEAVLPNAKIQEINGYRYLEVVDGRKVFGLERNEKNRFLFSLDSDGQFSELQIEFPLITSVDFGERIAKLKTLFGDFIGPRDIPGGLSYEWPSEDGIKLTVRGQFGIFGMGGRTYVIVNKQLDKPRLNKAELGL
jgi:hypothetical protein